MAVIGTFTRARDGGWEGSIRTLGTRIKARFVPNDDRSKDAAPDFHVQAGQFDLGAAWVRRKTSDSKEYLSVQLDDPVLPQPIKAALFYSHDSESAHLIWNRYKPE